MKTIEQVVIQWLDTGRTEVGFKVTEFEKRSQQGYMRWIGSVMVTEDKGIVSYLVEYESLMPLHGSGVDDINTVTSITAIS